MATAQAIITDALTELGVLEPGETLTSDMAALGLLRFQNQLDAWQADRLTLSVQSRTTFTITSGTSSVTIGPSGADVTTQRPVWINSLTYIVPGSSPSVEVPIGLLDEDAYAALSIKSLSSALPMQAFYQTNITTTYGTLFLWPTVNQSVGLVLYAPQGVNTPSALTTSVIGPPGYQEAFMYQLALRLCNPFGVAPTQILIDLAARAYATLKAQNVDPGILGVDAALVPGLGGGYNVLTDVMSGSSNR